MVGGVEECVDGIGVDCVSVGWVEVVVGGGLSVVMICRMAMVAAFMEDMLCGVRLVRVVALRRGAALGRGCE